MKKTGKSRGGNGNKETNIPENDVRMMEMVSQYGQENSCGILWVSLV